MMIYYQICISFGDKYKSISHMYEYKVIITKSSFKVQAPGSLLFIANLINSSANRMLICNIPCIPAHLS